MESEVRSRKEIGQETQDIAGSIGQIHRHQVQKEPVDDIVQSRGSRTHYAKPQRLTPQAFAIFSVTEHPTKQQDNGVLKSGG